MKLCNVVCCCFYSFFACQLLQSQELFTVVGTNNGLQNIRNNNGIAVADYDGDNDLDIFVVAVAKDQANEEVSKSKLLRNNNDGTFTDVTPGSGLENLLPFDELDSSYDNFLGIEGYKFGVSWGDYDNDGLPDLFFTHRTKVQLFHNDGNGQFSDVTTQSNIQGKNGCANSGATWFDYDNDGYLDLYIADWNGCSSNRLYRNNTNGTFTNVTETVGIKLQENFHSYTPFPFDFNEDGKIDLYVSNDLRKKNNLFINGPQNVFSEQGAVYGLDNPSNDMGIAIGDYNKDGKFDFFITAIDENFLFSPNENNQYSDQAAIAGVSNTGWGWGAKFADFDLDGDEDLIVVNGYDTFGRRQENNVLFENVFSNGSYTFQERINSPIALNGTMSVEALDFDYDNDGDLDLAITNSFEKLFFYENNTNSQGNATSRSWLQVSLEGSVSNKNGVGSILTLQTDQGEFKRYSSGVGYLSQSIKPIHFGLDNSTNIRELKIKWPSGIEDVYNNLPLNAFIKAKEGDSFEVLNLQPAVKILGCTDPSACNFDPNAMSNNGSCQYLNLSESDITGPRNSSFLKTETYAVNTSGNTVSWRVEGGEIIGLSTGNSIEVQWAIKPSGKVFATLTDGSCNSVEKSIAVQLSATADMNEVSVARLWNEALLEAIRGDFARPTVHARNLFHFGIAVYDSWAIYDKEAKPYLMGNNLNNFQTRLDRFVPAEENTIESQKKAMSYAVYRLLMHRFKNSPGFNQSADRFNLIMSNLDYDISFTDLNYQDGDAAALGNYIAESIINYGLNDGSREAFGYDNAYYTVSNPPLAPIVPGNSSMVDPNRWQSLSLDSFIDQSGNPIDGTSIDFLSPEWGNVFGFALTQNDKKSFLREGNTYSVYHDPSPPPFLGDSNPSIDRTFKDGFSMVSIWSSHLDPNDGVIWDISPSNLGNLDLSAISSNLSSFKDYYNYFEGGDIGNGHAFNPITRNSYDSQRVPRGDYSRVIAEYWADGPDSETPPGHWFTILNYINDHPLLERKLEGLGEELDPLEWDVKSYFLLSGAMHDAAISAWSIKGWYDYVRPISAIRYMAGLGQSSDENLASYHPQGIPLKVGFIELVEPGDPLAGQSNEHVGKIKLYTWRGHDNIINPITDQAGVGWILAERWWPYQRPSFVTPPFAGYVSGHSTFSRAAAEVLTLLTGDPYFPGGLGQFTARKNEFLVFEEGPSVDVVLQWATYRDASDQSSLSRIWGGIHPPADDLPGRKIGEKVGKAAFNYGKTFFTGKEGFTISKSATIFPNPVESNGTIIVMNTNVKDEFFMINMLGKQIRVQQEYNQATGNTSIRLTNIPSGVYILVDSVGRKSKVLVK